jgi:hypothetical protein
MKKWIAGVAAAALAAWWLRRAARRRGEQEQEAPRADVVYPGMVRPVFTSMDQRRDS